MSPALVALSRLWRPSRWMIDPAALRPGDLILSTQHAVGSLLIRLGTRSAYSHAAVALGDGLLAEAVGLGVRRRSVTAVVKPRLLVRRLDPALHPDAADIAERAALETERCMHQGYWISGAMRALFVRTPPDRRGRMFCSQLAAHAYQAAGALALVPGKSAENTTPADLARSRALKTVAAVYRPALVPGYLVDDSFESLADSETVAVQATFVRACDWLEAHGLGRPPHWIGLQQQLATLRPVQLQQELDHHVTQWLTADGYFHLITRARHEVLEPLEELAGTAGAPKDGHRGDRMEFFLMAHGRAALAKQSADEAENAAVYRELLATAPLQTFDMLGWRSEANSAVSARAVEAIDAILAALDARHGFTSSAPEDLRA